MDRFQQYILLLGIASLCVACNATKPVAGAESEVPAAPTTSVVALGRLEPEGEVIKVSVPNAQDSRVNQILVREGDRVQAGQVLAILQGIDRRQADVRDAQAEVRLRRAELTRIRQGEAKQGAIAAQAAALARSQADLATSRVQRQAAIASATAILREAELTYQRRQALAEEGAIARADLDAALKELETARATLAERQAELTQTLTTLEAEITQKRAELAELREVRPIDIEIAAAQLEQAEIAVEQQQANLEDVRVRAPIAGQILRINTRIGEQVNTTQGIMELARTDQMVVQAEVSEVDISQIRQGQRATITSEYGGFTGEIQGVVEQIGLQIGRRSLQEADTAATGDPTVDSNARVVVVKISIDPADNAKVTTFTNMQVRVTIDLSA